jgi:DNA repair protein RecN (Recombination protein N)
MLEKEARRALALAKESAAEISARRKEAAARFSNELTALATPLGMKNLRMEVAVNPADISATGTDHVEFMFAFNKNQPLMPVAGIASGGEISRLMLCLKAIIAGHMSLPTIIFDEVDTGVSGDVAARIGAMMQRMGSSIQVITITHLPQVAARGNSHYKVFKQDDEDSTHTAVVELSAEERIAEIALMLSGNASDPAARATAKVLLDEQH